MFFMLGKTHLTFYLLHLTKNSVALLNRAFAEHFLPDFDGTGFGYSIFRVLVGSLPGGTFNVAVHVAVLHVVVFLINGVVAAATHHGHEYQEDESEKIHDSFHKKATFGLSCRGFSDKKSAS
jgi:hypothetical protein